MNISSEITREIQQDKSVF